MKIRFTLLTSLLAPLVSFADVEPTPGAQANVTLSIVVHEWASIPNSENSKLVRYKYAAKDLLQELLEEGNLGDETSISGWKLVVVDRNPLFDGDHELAFYAVKKGKTPILIESDRFRINIDAEVGVEASVMKFKGDNLSSYKASFKALVNFYSDSEFHDYSVNTTALASGTSSYAVKKLKLGGETFSYDYSLFGAVSFKPLLGSYEYDGTKVPVEGSIKFSAFSALDITDYPAPPLIED